MGLQDAPSEANGNGSSSGSGNGVAAADTNGNGNGGGWHTALLNAFHPTAAPTDSVQSGSYDAYASVDVAAGGAGGMASPSEGLGGGGRPEALVSLDGSFSYDSMASVSSMDELVDGGFEVRAQRACMGLGASGCGLPGCWVLETRELLQRDPSAAADDRVECPWLPRAMRRPCRSPRCRSRCCSCRPP